MHAKCNNNGEMREREKGALSGMTINRCARRGSLVVIVAVWLPRW